MRIGLAQIDMGFEHKQYARTLCHEMILTGAKENVDFMVFPEMTLTGFTVNSPRKVSAKRLILTFYGKTALIARYVWTAPLEKPAREVYCVLECLKKRSRNFRGTLNS
ncbi:hypothetical protein SDC9_156400 [bioreactor metagenome]|uniref:CN hydrolase domain-containing protein n=1 Tax=bioreactor metagenome TaxID=1076179 RepID=A0A645F6G2_9ZZZZ